MIESDAANAGAPDRRHGPPLRLHVSTSGMRRTREVDLAKAIPGGARRRPDAVAPPARLLYRARRGVMAALAISDVFARQTGLES